MSSTRLDSSSARTDRTFIRWIEKLTMLMRIKLSMKNVALRETEIAISNPSSSLISKVYGIKLLTRAHRWSSTKFKCLLIETRSVQRPLGVFWFSDGVGYFRFHLVQGAVWLARTEHSIRYLASSKPFALQYPFRTNIIAHDRSESLLFKAQSFSIINNFSFLDE